MQEVEAAHAATLRRVALVSGAIFVVAGLVKFVFHDWELDAFRRFDLPHPNAFVVAAGVVEVVGGVLLLMRRWVAPTAFMLAVTMAIATVVSGFIAGDVIPSLTLAPALLAAMLYLLWVSLRFAPPRERGRAPRTRAGT